MSKDKIKKQRILILSFSVLWLIVMTFLFVMLPEVIPIQFNLKGDVANAVPKVSYFILVTVFYGLYLLYCWIRFGQNMIGKKQAFTIYFLMGFSLFILILGQIVQ